MNWKFDVLPQSNLLLVKAFGVLRDEDILAVPKVLNFADPVVLPEGQSTGNSTDRYKG